MTISLVTDMFYAMAQRLRQANCADEITAGDIISELDRGVMAAKRDFNRIALATSEPYTHGIIDGLKCLRKRLRSEEFRSSIIENRKANKCP